MTLMRLLSWSLSLCFVCTLLGTSTCTIASLATYTPAFTPANKSKDRLTLRLKPRHSIHLESAPLIGGPTWLPLHVKVVKENIFFNETTTFSLKHQWDLIPVNATSSKTLKQLLMLRNVPSQIRYRLYGTAHGAPEKAEFRKLLPVLSIVYDANSMQQMPHDFVGTMYKCFEPQIVSERFSLFEVYLKYAEQQSSLQEVHDFCRLYQHQTHMELHLITNNCWRFALQLCFYWLQRDQDGHGDVNSNLGGFVD